MPETRGDARTAALVVLATLAVIAALYLGAEFLVPIAFAVVLNALFRPAVRALQRLRVPAPAGAAVVVLGLLALLVAGGFALTGPVKSWWEKAPERFAAAQARLEKFRKPFQQLTEAASQVEHVVQGPSTSPSSQPAGAQQAQQAQDAQSVQPASLAPPGLASSVLGGTTKLVGGVAGVLVLLYLILASGGVFLHKLVKVLPRPQDKAVADDVVHESEAVVLRYMYVTLLINLGQGAVVAGVFWWLGMPTPLLWGAFTVVLEFIPYLGAAIMIVLISVTALATFDSAGRILLAPGSYLLIATLQNNLVSPIAYGKRLKLNPVAVLLGVLFWYFVWGIPGAFLAVPIIATLKVLADRVDGLRPVGEFLGE